MRKICLVTGSNNDIGFETAKGLAAQGYQIVMLCRSRQRGEAARQKIAAATGHTPDLLLADLSSQREIKHTAAQSYDEAVRRQIVAGARAADTPVSVCGELAGDPLGVMALLGMGIDTLSMSVGSLLRAKKVILSFSLAELADLFEQAVEMPDAFMIRELYASRLDERGLGGFIRAGK